MENVIRGSKLMKRLFINRHMQPIKDHAGKTILPNPGDLWSSPKHYWKEFDQDEHIDIINIKRYQKQLGTFNQIIVGGGGLIGNANFDPLLEKLIPLKDRVWFWGVGINQRLTGSKEFTRVELKEIRKTTFPDYRLLKKFNKDQVFVRDQVPDDPLSELTGFNFIPCCSCMHRVFDPLLTGTKFSIRKKFLFIAHNKMEQMVSKKSEFFNLGDPAKSTKTYIIGPSCTIEEIVSQIMAHEIIITQSYHGALWGHLCGKQVCVYQPWSNKFLYIRPKTDMITIDEVNIQLVPKSIQKRHLEHLMYDFTALPVKRNTLSDFRKLTQRMFEKITLRL